MALSVAARPVSVSSTTGRFSSPAAYQKLTAQLKKDQAELPKAKAAVAAQRGLMMRAMFSPEGYQHALHRLHGLEGRVTHLQNEIKSIKHTLMVA